jgi:pimeloyl-ACP methyl ester carboxylesterase
VGYVDHDGVRLYFEEAGGGDPPIVFVHGWCCDHTFSEPQFRHFAGSHRVVTVDLRGCGRSDGAEAYEVASFARRRGTRVPRARARPARRRRPQSGRTDRVEMGTRHPSLVGAVVAVDPGPIDPLPETARAFEAFATQTEGPDGEAVRRALVESNFLPTDDAERRRDIVETMCAVPLASDTAMFRAATRWNGVGALRLCGAPVLVILSATGNSNDPARLRAVKPDVQIGVTVGAGHFHQLEVPEQVTPMIERFLALAPRRRS